MKVGGANWSGTLNTDLHDTEVEELTGIIGEALTEEFVYSFNKCLSVLDWDGYERNAANWGDARPEFERLVRLLDGFAAELTQYCNSYPGTPKAAAIYLACEPVAEWFEHPLRHVHNEAPHYTELRDTVVSFHQRAARNLELQIELAKSAGRPSDINFGQLVFNLIRFLEQQGENYAIATDRKSDELYSPFWSFVIGVAGRIRKKPHAGFNSHQAALLFVKRALKKFRNLYPET